MSAHGTGLGRRHLSVIQGGLVQSSAESVATIERVDLTAYDWIVVSTSAGRGAGAPLRRPLCTLRAPRFNPSSRARFDTMMISKLDQQVARLFLLAGFDSPRRPETTRGSEGSGLFVPLTCKGVPCGGIADYGDGGPPYEEVQGESSAAFEATLVEAEALITQRTGRTGWSAREGTFNALLNYFWFRYRALHGRRKGYWFVKPDPTEEEELSDRETLVNAATEEAALRFAERRLQGWVLATAVVAEVEKDVVKYEVVKSTRAPRQPKAKVAKKDAS